MHKSILRIIHTGLPHLLRRPGKRANPGTAHQLKALESVEDIEHDFADLEPDFQQLHKTNRQFEIDDQLRQERTRRMVVKQKYFHEKFPNFLTFAEKEQIRLLHDLDAEEWSIEKLAESFPATPEIINKIVRADWKIKSAKRLRKHDESVLKNWELLRAGGITNLQPALKEHLLKFANRTKNDLLNVERELREHGELPKPKVNEFSSIIDIHQNTDEQHRESITSAAGKKFEKYVRSIPNVDGSEDTYLIDKVHDKRPMRFQELKQYNIKKINDSVEKDNACLDESLTIKQNELEMYGKSDDTAVSPKDPHNSNDNNYSTKLIEKFQSTEIVVSREDRTLYEMKTVKNRIYIPKKLRSKGATYKVEDCYYDDDGEFLYRVPGMMGKQI